MISLLAQGWANYGPRAAYGPLGHFVWPAVKLHVHTYDILRVYVEVILSIRLEFSRF